MLTFQKDWIFSELLAGSSFRAIFRAVEPEGQSELARLNLEETLRRNLRKSVDDRYESLMTALRHTYASGQWPIVDRRLKEQRMLCSIQRKSSAS